jgi:hypothetical protein
MARLLRDNIDQIEEVPDQYTWQLVRSITDKNSH